MDNKQYKVLSMLMGILLIVSMLIVGKEAADYVTSRQVKMDQEKMLVVIDAGHGGYLLRK